MLGENHPDTARSYNNVGYSYWELGESQKAFNYVERAYEIALSTLGSEHSITKQYQEDRDYVKKYLG